jgi:hypothetical protein
MLHVNTGQCGLCLHYGETHPIDKTPALMQIRTTHEAPETLLDECGHPKHAALHLRVSAISGCDAFEAAKAN